MHGFDIHTQEGNLCLLLQMKTLSKDFVCLIT